MIYIQVKCNYIPDVKQVYLNAGFKSNVMAWFKSNVLNVSLICTRVTKDKIILQKTFILTPQTDSHENENMSP